MATLKDRLKDPKVIAAALALATPVATALIMPAEGKRNVTYLDVAKIPTACYGHTGKDTGKVGTRHSDAACQAMLDRDVSDHMTGLLRCAPVLAEKPAVLGAVTSLTFNIGVSAACRSTAVTRFNRRDWRGGCEAVGPYFTAIDAQGRQVTRRGYIMAGGKVYNGLVTRRTNERNRCLAGI